MTAAVGDDQGVAEFSTCKGVENLRQPRKRNDRRATTRRGAKRSRKQKSASVDCDYPPLPHVEVVCEPKKMALASMGPKLHHETFCAAAAAPAPPTPVTFKHPSTAPTPPPTRWVQFIVRRPVPRRPVFLATTPKALPCPVPVQAPSATPVQPKVSAVLRKPIALPLAKELLRNKIRRLRSAKSNQHGYGSSVLSRIYRQSLRPHRRAPRMLQPAWVGLALPWGLAAQGNCIPLYVEDPSDFITPVTAYLKLAFTKDYSFLLESSAGGEKVGRYSFIGYDPYDVITVNGSDPLVPVEAALKPVRYVALRDLPYLTGGAVGYVGFDCIHAFEPRTLRPLKDVLGVPDSIFMLANNMVVFDHLTNAVRAVSHVRFEGESVDEATLRRLYDEAVDHVCATIMALRQDATPEPPQGPISLDRVGTSNVGQAGYEGFVRHLKEHIVKGDIFQAVPSQRIARPTDLHPFNIYRKLRNVNPSPYMFYVHLKDFQIVGASPEALVKVVNGVVETHPIAGTRKRGQTEAEDIELERDLLADEKERAEHIMLVDLGRNDVNRVAISETVKANKLMVIERYSHVMHIVSNVTGTLRPECTIYDAFRSIFPAGTVSGAPKIRAIELIQEAEKEKRHVYAGAVGYFSYAGDTDTCIALRTMVVKDGVAYLQAGGGIVYDSDPTAEYEETINKMNANDTAIRAAELYFKERYQDTN